MPYFRIDDVMLAFDDNGSGGDPRPTTASSASARKPGRGDTMMATPAHVAIASIRDLVTIWDGEAALRACTVPLLSIGSAGPVNDAKQLGRVNPSIVIGQTVGSVHFNQLEVSRST